jgi:sterol desaturase/sphingolipid hydroxylase (fatty acid hydroxylase superfamily)
VPSSAPHHGNIRLWAPLDRVLSLVRVTPNVHKIHRSRAMSETSSNYANLLTIYDRLLRTYTPWVRAESVTYGVLADERQQRIEVAAAASVRVSADRLGLRDAVTNLVDNAIKYSPTGVAIVRHVRQLLDQLQR